MYLGAVYVVTRNLSFSLLLAFVATLPFPKGKAYQILLLPWEQIERWALYKISYFFPLYLSDMFLFALCYVYFRGRFLSQTTKVTAGMRTPLVLFFLFIVWVVGSGITSAFPEVTLLSAAQLLRMMVVFFSPFMVKVDRKHLHQGIYCIAAAVLLFESAWVGLQGVSGGPLGRDIEVFLSGAEYGSRSAENPELFRLSGTFFEPSIMGTFLLMQASLLAVAVLKRAIVSTALVRTSLLAVAAGSAALVFTGSRVLYGIWAGLAIVLWRLYRRGMIINHLIQRARPSWRYTIVAGCALFLLLPYMTVRLASLTDVFTQYGSATYRLQMMVYAIRLAALYPLSGVGINLSPYHLATGFVGERFVFDPTYPHNLLFQLLAETGIVGLVLFLLFVYSVFRRRINGFGIAALVYLICAQFYPIFLNHPELSSFFFLYAGLSLLPEKSISHA